MHVAKGSKMREFYEKTPIFLNFLVYIFNVTNKEEFINGSELSKLYLYTEFKHNNFQFFQINATFHSEFILEKPRLQEIGPYFFE